MKNVCRSAMVASLLVAPLAVVAAAWSPAPPTAPPAAPGAELPGLKYDVPFFPGAQYDPAIPTPDSVLGFEVGSRPASHAQIEAVITALAAKSPRAKLFEYAKSHEGRALYYLVLSSEANLKGLEPIKADVGKLADPRSVSAEEGDRLAETLPAVAWMAYAIHGDEMSGSDAALALAYHLAASTDEAVRKMLDELVVIIDPLMNPDGRERCLANVTQNRTVQPSVDDQSIIHTQVWPWGRMNHYLFDMNRDWIYGTQPESRGRIAAAGQWHPHFFMESHEMGSQDTFLFFPPREPLNPNMPPNIRKWFPVFARDHAAAFDRLGWRYYHGEWNEEWYPGYSSTWAALRNAAENLYEQAQIVSDGVRRMEGTIQSYREAVHHQLVSSIANLQTLQANRHQVLRDYLAERRKNVSAEGPYAGRTFAILPSANTGRLRTFTDLLTLQGFEMYTPDRDFTASGKDRLGREFNDRTFPGDTILVPNRQPEAPLVAALLEFDPHMTVEFLNDERRELLRFGRSKLYDVTAWNLAMMFDVEGYELAMALPEGAVRFTGIADGLPTPREEAKAQVALVIDGADDRCITAAGRLMERGVHVRVADKPFQFDGRDFARGSVVITWKDNLNFAGDLDETVAQAAAEVGLRALGVKSGLGPGDLPDLGGQHFVLLEPPRIAVLGRDAFNPYTYGEIWHLIDHVLGLRASYLNADHFGGADLRRYNVVVLPDTFGDAPKVPIEGWKAWVEGGGTLIAIGSSAAALTKETEGLGSTRLLSEVLTQLDEHRQAIVREWEARMSTIDPSTVWARNPPAELSYPWLIGQSGDKPDEDELKRRDAWRALFSPQGVILAGRVDDRSWLTAGCGDYVPVLWWGDTVFVAFQDVQAPVRLGVYIPDTKPRPAEKAESTQPAQTGTTQPEIDGSKKEAHPAQEEKGKPGWTVAPPGYELRLRMSGLLWPEAADRLAHSAYVTRERIGSGQVILFASSPTFRAAALGTTRVFANAVVCGPGMGAAHPIRP
ncbi:MAG: M14 family metallopeptidase [Planctomycetota bacterium]